MASVKMCEIFEAFTSQNKPELKMEKIKEFVFRKHGNSFEGYNDKYSFDQTIQQMVERRCKSKKGYMGKSVFISPRRAYYQIDKDSKEFIEYEKEIMTY
jgi:hypothetical protein